MKKLITLLLTSAVLLTTGCASNLMKPAESETIVNSNDKATIVFMRNSFVASAIGVEMFEVVDGKLEFIGSLPTGNKIAHKTSPGKKVYMAYGTAADFMIADVRAGKTYYSIVRPNWGTGGFAPTPIRPTNSEYTMQSEDFAGWVKNTKLVELKKAEAETWFAGKKEDYQKIYADYWNRFQNKTPFEQSQRTLNPEDGV